jgi:hypothetical protein
MLIYHVEILVIKGIEKEFILPEQAFSPGQTIRFACVRRAQGKVCQPYFPEVKYNFIHTK